MNKEFVKKLAKIQKELKAPKSQYNKFGQYNYRNAEDILEAVKPFLGELSLTLNDDVVLVGERVYVKSTVTITDGESNHSVTAFAREPEDQKGMSCPQITGAASSYSSKYALGKLFLLDDTKDADTNEVAELAAKGDKKDKPSKFGRAKTTPTDEKVDDNKSEDNESAKETPQTEEKAKPNFRRSFKRS